jgi:hypothetical protein
MVANEVHEQDGRRKSGGWVARERKAARAAKICFPFRLPRLCPFTFRGSPPRDRAPFQGKPRRAARGVTKPNTRSRQEFRSLSTHEAWVCHPSFQPLLMSALPACRCICEDAGDGRPRVSASQCISRSRNICRTRLVFRDVVWLARALVSLVFSSRSEHNVETLLAVGDPRPRYPVQYMCAGSSQVEPSRLNELPRLREGPPHTSIGGYVRAGRPAAG